MQPNPHFFYAWQDQAFAQMRANTAARMRKERAFVHGRYMQYIREMQGLEGETVLISGPPWNQSAGTIAELTIN